MIKFSSVTQHRRSNLLQKTTFIPVFQYTPDHTSAHNFAIHQLLVCFDLYENSPQLKRNWCVMSLTLAALNPPPPQESLQRSFDDLLFERFIGHFEIWKAINVDLFHWKAMNLMEKHLWWLVECVTPGLHSSDLWRNVINWTFYHWNRLLT